MAFKENRVVRVGDVSFMLSIHKCGEFEYPRIQITPTHNSPFHIDLVLYDRAGLEELGAEIIKFAEELA